MSEPGGPETTRRLPVTGEGEPAGSGPDRSAPAAEHTPLPAPDGAGDGSGRFWSARRIPAAVLAPLVLAAAGLLLYDVVAVRAGRTALRWRRSLARELAERPLDDTWVLAGAGAATALGLWLFVLAVTPGLRGILPMRRPRPDVRAGLRRDAAATVLRDRAMEVSGVRSVRVRTGRGKADVRAVSHFRELDDVRADLDAALADVVRGLGLARRPALSVRVTRPGRKG